MGAWVGVIGGCVGVSVCVTSGGWAVTAGAVVGEDVGRASSVIGTGCSAHPARSSAIQAVTASFRAIAFFIVSSFFLR